MGSFDVACSVSRITINSGMPVVYFPLELYQYCYDPAAPNNTLIHPWCYYVPVSLPIFGEYYDYGYIDPIETDVSTKALEKHFKCPIEVIVGAEGQSPCAGMFVHRDIYQCMVDNQIDEWGKTKAGEHFGTYSREELNKRYNTLRDALIKRRDAIAEQKKAKPEDKWKFSSSVEDYHIRDLGGKFGFREFDTFMSIYLPIIQRNWLKKRIVDFMFFNMSLSYANVHYFPAMNGYQHGNHYGNRIVHTKALEILNERIKKDEKERAEDE